MTTEIRRRCGVVFESTSIDKAAAKCARAAATWGGLAMVFVDSTGLVEAIVPGTLCADIELRRRPGDLVGTYSVPMQVDRLGAIRRQIAGDIWQHMTDLAGADSRDGQRIRAMQMMSEAA